MSGVRGAIRHEDVDYSLAPRVLKAFRQGVRRGDLAARFGCSRATIRRFLELAEAAEAASVPVEVTPP